MSWFCYTGNMAARGKTHGDGGFTLIELLVVVLIIGILSSVAVPRYIKDVEKGKADEAVEFFFNLKGSQERYYAKYGTYCIGPVATCGLDITPPTLRFFIPPTSFVVGSAGVGPPYTSWALSVKRNSASWAYGAYTLTYDVEPNKAPVLSCTPANPCTTDLLPS